MYLGFNKNVKNKHVVRILRTGRIVSSVNVEIDNENMAMQTQESSHLAQNPLQPSLPDAPSDCEGGSSQMKSAFSSAAEITNWRSPIFENSGLLDKGEMAQFGETLGLERHQEVPANVETRSSLREKPPSSKALENIVLILFQYVLDLFYLL